MHVYIPQKISRVLKPLDEGEEGAVTVDIDPSMTENDVIEEILKCCS